MPRNPLRSADVEELLIALTHLESADGAYAFLEDLCTPREITDMAQRLVVARMLAGGSHYLEIQEATGASATTIARVSKAWNYGAGGYRDMVERIGSIPSTQADSPSEEGAR